MVYLGSCRTGYFRMYSIIRYVLQVKAISRDIFPTFHLLDVLILSGNKLQKISNYTFTTFTHLLILDASDNSINALEPLCFHRLIRLRYLNLMNNKIMAINLGEFTSGLTILLDGNWIKSVNGLMGLAQEGHDKYYYWTSKTDRLIGKFWSKVSQYLACMTGCNNATQSINLPNIGIGLG